jgi:FkbM family methyltransferase
MAFLYRILNYLKRNFRRDVICFKLNTSYYPFQHQRNVQKIINLNGKNFTVVDFLSYIWQYKEIFIDRIYEIPGQPNKKVIIDCGANIGLASYFFASSYPDAEIHSIEADPQIFEFLKKNMNSLCQNVNIKFINKAVWKDDTSEISFQASGSDAGKVVSTNNGSIKVPTLSIANYIQNFQSIDLLKIDIEGAEREVFPNLAPVLRKFKFLFLEYHAWEGEKEFLSEILSILEKSGFKYNLEPIGARKNLFLSAPGNHQLNIFAVNQTK